MGAANGRESLPVMARRSQIHAAKSI